MMFRYVLVFLLINCYSRSLGAPSDRKSNVVIGDLLSGLKTRCPNLTIIDTKIKDCNVAVPPYGDVQLQCLIFYDANQLLCDFPAAYPTFEADYESKINEKLNYTNFCEKSANWTLPKTSHYDIITKVLLNEFRCNRVCINGDVFDPETNFYCKYYKMAIEALASIQKKTQHVSDKMATSSLQPKVEEKVESVGDIKLDNATNISSDDKNTVSELTKNNETKPVDTASTKVNVATAQDLTSTGQVSGSATSQKNNQTQDPDDKFKKTDDNLKLTEIAEKSEKDDNVEKTGSTNKKPVEKDEIQDDKSNDGVIDHPNQNRLDDYNPDLEIEGMPDPQDREDDEDAIGDGLGDLDAKLDTDQGRQLGKQSRNENQELKAMDIAQRDSYANIMPDAGFSEDDDHFFPFFLTSVIVVVILYVLYHNKNKVSKMFFGLIVEGRQPGRRRNSRGHAYRRLDTLEQAMNSNTAAPPSKIIY